MQEEVVKSRNDWIQDLYYREFHKPKLHPKDFYWDEGKMVLTEQYHLKRGSCCNSGCKHCPYGKYKQSEQKIKKLEKGNSKLPKKL